MAIEFSRNITFGQYLDRPSPIHRLDPRIKIVGFGLLLAVLLGARTGMDVAIGALGVGLSFGLAQIPLGYALRGLRLVVGTVLIIIAFQVLFFPNPSDPWWQWGVISLSLDGLRQGGLVFVRVILLYQLTSTLLLTTPLMDLADGMEALLSPLKWLGLPINELVMSFVIALKFVPLLVHEVERMVKARAARGDRFERARGIARARWLGGLLIPLFVNALGRAEAVTTAMNARCYRGGIGRTRRRVLRLGRADYVALGLAVACLASALAW